MIVRRGVLAVLSIGLFIVALAGGPAAAAPPDPADDGNGKQWRQLYETTGLSWSQVAQICPRDGATPCSGSIGPRVFTGWIWGTDAQVTALMGNYAPAILTADPPSVSGGDYFWLAQEFLADLRWTASVSGYGFYREWAAGWTSSTDEAGQPIAGSVGYGWWPPSGGFGLAAVGDAGAQDRGVFLWRPSAGDHTPPAITPSVAGTAGSGGWYVSDVSVSWDVQDAESAITSRIGCDPQTVETDTAGTTLSCQATSAGGTATGSALVKRDTTPPTVTCPSPEPVFEIYRLGAWVAASVADATSGPASPVAQGAANTNTAGSFTTLVTGADRAGHRRSALCSYRVVVPTCNGLTATRVGTSGNDIINGTSGRDVIVALGGADNVKGNGGDDVICGGDGPDTIDGGDGADWIDGGASPDDLSGGNGNDTLDGGLHNDSLRGGNGTDTCRSGETRLSSCEL
jgi:hypothetical protein